MSPIRIETTPKHISFGHKLTKTTHKNMLTLLKKMHAQDTFKKTDTELKGSAICKVSTDRIKLNTCKIPTIKPTPFPPDEYVRRGNTVFRFPDNTVVQVDNYDGGIIRFFDEMKQGGGENYRKRNFQKYKLYH